VTTHLFDGQKFDDAVAVYRRVLAEAREVEGPAPNYCSGWDDGYGLLFDVEERDGYRLEGFDFLGFRIEKGNSSNEYYLRRKKIFPMFESDEYETVAQVYASKPRTAAGVAESVLGYVMQLELLELLDTADCANTRCKVSVKDVNKIGGYERWVLYRNAWTVKREMAETIISRERGNAICYATIEVVGLGYISIPPFGRNRFVPTQGREASDEEFETAVGRYPQEMEEIRRLWTHIARHTTGRGFEANRFEFEGTWYVASHNPNAQGRPESTQICRHYVGSRSWVKLLDAYRSGLLAAWAESLN